MIVEEVEISALSNDPANVRRHPPEQIEKLVASLRRFKQTLPLLADRSNVIRVGNARLEAMRRLGWERVKVVYLDLSPSEWASLAIADNALHDQSSFDQGALAAVLDALRSEDADLATAAGFTLDEIATLLGANNGPAPAEAPADFAAVDESIEVDHECPRCKFRWSGSSAPAEGEQ